MKEKNGYPLWFRILLPLFCLLILFGALYAILYSRGTFSQMHASDADSYLFDTAFEMLPDDNSDPLQVKIIYDSVLQKMTVCQLTDASGNQKENYVRMPADSFRRIIDMYGGISVTDTDGSETVMNGEEAYNYVFPADSERSFEKQAELFITFIEDLRTHSNDEVFMLKVLAFAFPKVETNISLKLLSAFGKSMLKADTIEYEVIYDR